MERRCSERTVVRLNAELISEGVSYGGVIENFSKDGVYIRTAPTKTPAHFALGTPVELKFQRLSEEPLNLHLYCKVRWSYKTPPHGLTTSIGLEIIDPAVIERTL